MPYLETSRIVPGARTAVLFLHGIAGTPDHFRTLIDLESLVPEHWSCRNVLLPGHGKRVEDFSRSSMQAWEAYAMGEFDSLCQTHEHVIIVGHSMGTLFALQMALARPEKVPFLCLISVPLRVWVRLFGACNIIRFGFGILNFRDPVQASLAAACSIRPTRKVWKYIGWIPRLVELFQLMRQVEKRIPNLAVPAIAFQSVRDELVSAGSGKILRNSGRVDVQELPHSTHFYYAKEDVKIIRDAFVAAYLGVENEKTI